MWFGRNQNDELQENGCTGEGVLVFLLLSFYAPPILSADRECWIVFVVTNRVGSTYDDPISALDAATPFIISRYLGRTCQAWTGASATQRGTVTRYESSDGAPYPWYMGRSFIYFNEFEQRCVGIGAYPDIDWLPHTIDARAYEARSIPNGVPECKPRYVIRLTNTAAEPIGDTLAEVEPSASITTLIAQVFEEDSGAQVSVPIELRVSVKPKSGGHEHDDALRHSSHAGRLVLLSSGDGYSSDDGKQLNGYTGLSGLRFRFNAPAPAGDHEIMARCTDTQVSCTFAGPKKVWVGIKDLRQLEADPSYVLITPNADQNHPSNHYVSESTQRKIRSLATDYHSNWFPNDPLLHLNDASLVRGGLFDLGANWSSQPRGHKTHREGTDIDVRANEFYHDPSQSIPTSNYVDLMNRIAPDQGCDAQIHSGATPNEHFHLYCR